MNENDIVVLKLISGEEVICFLEKSCTLAEYIEGSVKAMNSPEGVIIRCAMIYDGSGGHLSPWLKGASHKDMSIFIKNEHIMFILLGEEIHFGLRDRFKFSIPLEA